MKREIIVGFLLLFASTSQLLYSQTHRAVLRGQVADAAQASLAGVQIELTHQATNETRRVRTGPEGEFVISSLSLATYRLQIEHAGHRRYVRTFDGNGLRNLTPIQKDPAQQGLRGGEICIPLNRLLEAIAQQGLAACQDHLSPAQIRTDLRRSGSAILRTSIRRESPKNPEKRAAALGYTVVENTALKVQGS